MLERDFQRNLIKDIKSRFKGAQVLKTDARQIQGFPDLLVLYKNKWAALECKKDELVHKQPNQEYYVKELDEMSFARFISPLNKEEVLNDLERSWTSSRKTRIS